MSNDFEEIYNKYFNSVYKYLLSISKNKTIAEEITQETFYKALKNIDKYNPEYKMLTWLCQIAKNTYYSKIKKESRNIELNEDIINLDKEIIDKIIDNEEEKQILKFIHNLSEPYKEVLTLRIYCELSFREIGEIFEKSENWARVIYYRSKLKIKENLDEKRM